MRRGVANLREAPRSSDARHVERGHEEQRAQAHARGGAPGAGGRCRPALAGRHPLLASVHPRREQRPRPVAAVPVRQVQARPRGVAPKARCYRHSAGSKAQPRPAGVSATIRPRKRRLEMSSKCIGCHPHFLFRVFPGWSSKMAKNPRMVLLTRVDGRTRVDGLGCVWF